MRFIVGYDDVFEDLCLVSYLFVLKINDLKLAFSLLVVSLCIASIDADGSIRNQFGNNCITCKC